MKEKLKVVASGRCFFPAGALLWSTEEQVRIAKKVGYEGMEFLPTWRVVWEAVRYGKLLAPSEMVASFHRDWRFDRAMEAKLRGKPRWLYQLKNKEDWLFPPSTLCLKILKGLQEQYQVPVSTPWYADTENFSPVMLELWHRVQGIDQQGLLSWLTEEPKSRGIVLDIAKINSWLKSNQLLTQKEKALSKLFPHIFELHFRLGGVKRRLSIGGELSKDSRQNLAWFLQGGFKGRVVVELGWPDIEEPIVGWRRDFFQFLDVHRELVDWVKSF